MPGMVGVWSIFGSGILKQDVLVSSSGADGFGDYRSQVLAATNIVDLIGRSVALKRSGRDYLGLCPFHQEKTPSFTVKPDRQYFYCFGCKAKGNAVDFVMQRDRVTFIDALNQLGEQAGIERPQGRGGPSKEKAGEKQLLLEAQSAACSLFEKLLAHPEQGSAAREYLKQRGFNAESIKRSQIGLAPDGWEVLVRSPLMKKFTPELLALGGLAKRREKGDGHYDVFRNRIMFPIRDENARVIAFGGRVVPGSTDPAKYLNSPETPLFNKSRTVFGIDLARKKIVETRTAVVVEGYTDVVMAHQFGASNVVSPLGVGLTEQHVTILRRFADRIVLLFDPDNAGDAAVDRVVGLFITQPIEIAIAQIDSDLDPDEYLLKEGLEKFEKLIAAAPDALAYKWRQLSRRFNEDGGSLTGQTKAVEAYLELLSNARKSGPVDALRWGAALARVSRLTDIPVERLNKRFGRPPGSDARPGRAGARPTQQSAPRQGSAQAPGESRQRSTGPVRPVARDCAERWILGILLMHPDRWHATQRVVGVKDFTDEARRRLAELYWAHQRDQGEPVFNEFLGILGETARPAVSSPNGAAPSQVDGTETGEPGGSALSDLGQLAVEVVEEVEALEDADAMLAESLLFLEQDLQRRNERKLLAEVRRTDGQLSEQDEVALFRKIQEKARQPDLRRT
jgi:DNA primase